MSHNEKNPAAVELGRLGGKIGGPARARKLTQEQRSSIAQHAAHVRWQTKTEKGAIMEKWKKELTASEALRPKQGSPMPFIRCTQAGSDIDQKTGFRNTLFAHVGWKKTEEEKETVIAPFDVSIDGQHLGSQELKIDYDPARPLNNGAPSIHIHYNEEMKEILREKDMTGHSLTIENVNGGGLKLSIS